MSGESREIDFFRISSLGARLAFPLGLCGTNKCIARYYTLTLKIIFRSHIVNKSIYFKNLIISNKGKRKVTLSLHNTFKYSNMILRDNQTF